LASKVIEAGADVLIEKPISNVSDGLDGFLARAEELGRRVFVVCNMRFHPGVNALHKSLNRIGQPLFARAHYGNYLPNMRPDIDYKELYCSNRAKGGGVILDAIHEIDYLTWFFGEVSSVTCQASKLSSLKIDVEDWATLSLKHSRSSVSEIHLDYLRPFKRRGCEIVGDRGMLLWQSEGKAPEQCTVRVFLRESEKWETLVHSNNLDKNKPYEEMVAHFLDALYGKDVPLLKGREAAVELHVALEALEVAEASGSKVDAAETNI
jgi:predicted dehydrogenase